MGPTTEAENLRDLRCCVERIRSGPWSFVQLRGSDFSPDHIDADDVDLLGSRESVDALINAAFQWSRAGECHLRVTAHDGFKTTLSLFSLDGIHRIELDLWIELWQIDDRKTCLRLMDCRHLLEFSNGSIQRFPLPEETAIYLHHLIAKRKNLGGESAQTRLANYETALAKFGRVKLADSIRKIRNDAAIDVSKMKPFDAILDTSFPNLLRGQWRGRMIRKFRTSWPAVPRRKRLISVMGCDGAGKTTLAKTLQLGDPSMSGVLTGKHLYRKSWLYKLTVIFIRPLLFQSRENFDETLAPWVYLRACLGLRLKQWKSRRRFYLIDRTILDFLMVERKSDTPRFSRFFWLARYVGSRIPVIHCVLPYAQVVERKQEVTEAGHEAYDVQMFHELAHRVPTDYVVFNNSGSLKDATSAAALILQRIRGT